MSSLFDRHTIETPEQIELEFAVAGVGSRFLAMLVDSLIQSAALLVIGIIGIIAFAGSLGVLRSGAQWVVAGIIGLLFVLQFGYFALFEIVWNGQTPGKRAIGLRVIKDSGRPLSVAESIGRNLMRIVDQIPGFYALGFFVAILNSRSKRLGDFVAGSVVVYDRRPQTRATRWSSPASAGAASPQPSLLLAPGQRLTPSELALIDAFLHRRSDLADDIRYRMARDILSKLREKLTDQARTAGGVESTLESLAHEARETGTA